MAVLIDIDPNVLEVNRLISQAIISSTTNDQALCKLLESQEQMNYPISRHLAIEADAEHYGPLHWSNSLARFLEVKNSLIEIPIVRIAADISNKDFSTTLTNTISEFGERISFTNFTNVHTCIPTGMDFIREWPFNPNPVIVYSKYSKNICSERHPSFHYVLTPDEYISEVTA